jgi:glycosyltransferase involved in cell wall biosynthesis
MVSLTVVIPVLNEESLIEELVKRVVENCGKITDKYEIILVDDGSTDNTWRKISTVTKLNQKIKGLRFSRNFGHHYAITAGLHLASSEWVVVMDGDLQDRPEVIPDLYEKAQEGYEVVFVSRQNRPEPMYYQILQKVFYLFLRVLSGLNFDSNQANFSIINKKVVNAFKSFPENSRFYGSTILWLGFKRAKIFADHGERFNGNSSYTFQKRIKLAVDIILAFSERPLKFAIGIGLLVSTLSILGAVWLFFGSLTRGYTVSGWSSLIVSLFFFSGVILIVLGILGIYLGKVFQEVKRRPLYVVSEWENF